MQYRSRSIEVEAFEASDGCYVVRGTDDALRVMEPTAFHALFELAGGVKANGRGKANGKTSGHAPRGKAAKAPRLVVERTEPKGKGGRKPLPWFCRDCSNNTAGPECGSCGAPRPAPADRAPATRSA